MVEESDSDILEARSGDTMSNCFHVSANTSESEMVKVRAWCWCHDRRRGELPLYVAVGNNEWKVNRESLMLWHT